MDYDGKMIQTHSDYTYYKCGCATVRMGGGRYLTPVHRLTKKPLAAGKFGLRYANALIKFMKADNKNQYKI